MADLPSQPTLTVETAHQVYEALTKTGFVVGGQYFWRENMTFKVWLLTSDADADEDPFRLRIDFDFTLDKKHL